jgi:hypothetical protein
MKKNERLESLFDGKNEVEITDELIKVLIEEKKWSADAEETLREMAKMGAKWNLKRNSLVLTY